MLEPALVDGDTWDEVEARIHEKTAQLWLGDACAFVTEIWGEDIHVWLAGGRLKGLMELRPMIEETARYWGLKKATLKGRLGWDRLLRPFGYVRRDDVLEKML